MEEPPMRGIRTLGYAGTTALAVAFGSLLSSACTVVKPNQKPVAVLTAAPTQGYPPLTVYFDGTKSSDPDGKIVKYIWDFGDNTKDSTYYGAKATYVYNKSGNYSARLTVEDNDGARDSTSLENIVVVPNEAPQIILKVSPDSGVAPLLSRIQYACVDQDGQQDIVKSYMFVAKDTIQTKSLDSTFIFTQPGIYTTGGFCKDKAGAEAIAGPLWIQAIEVLMQRIAYTALFEFDASTGSTDIWSANIDGTGIKRLTCSANRPGVSIPGCPTTLLGQNIRPAYSPDGTKIAFQTTRNKIFDVYVMNADGSNQLKLVQTDLSTFSPTWSPDGKKVAFFYINSICPDWSDPKCAPTIIGLGIVSSSGGEFSKIYEGQLENSLSLPDVPSFSPDGKKIAFEIFKNGNFDIYVKNISDTILSDLGTNITNTPLTSERQPRWLPDDSGILFSADYGGTFNIYKFDFQSNRPKKIINGLDPYVTKDGKEVIFARMGVSSLYIIDIGGIGPERAINLQGLVRHPSSTK